MTPGAPEKSKQDFAQMIISARRDLNLSQKEFAERLGVTQQAVAKWENEQVIPSRRNQKRIMTLIAPPLTSGGGQPTHELAAAASHSAGVDLTDKSVVAELAQVALSMRHLAESLEFDEQLHGLRPERSTLDFPAAIRIARNAENTLSRLLKR